MTIAMLITLLAVLVLLACEWRGNRIGIAVAKSIASFGFVLAAFTNGARETPYGIAILAALVLSFVGDVFLLGADRRAFNAGLFAFLLAHLAFSAAFFRTGLDPVRLGFAALVFAMVGLATYRWLARYIEQRMRVPIIAYVVAIVIMASAAVGAHVHWFVPAAAVAFLVSDISVARDRFVNPSFANKLWGLPLYYLAQHLFAASV